jgi:hypothetical protein
MLVFLLIWFGLLIFKHMLVVDAAELALQVVREISVLCLRAKAGDQDHTDHVGNDLKYFNFRGLSQGLSDISVLILVDNLRHDLNKHLEAAILDEMQEPVLLGVFEVQHSLKVFLTGLI